MVTVSEAAYRVVVTREDDHWLADVPELQGAHTYARNLPTLDQAVREVIVLADDMPDEAMPDLVIEYDASRIHEAEVLAAVRRAGLPVSAEKPIPLGGFDYTGEFKDYAWPMSGLSPVNQKL